MSDAMTLRDEAVYFRTGDPIVYDGKTGTFVQYWPDRALAMVKIDGRAGAVTAETARLHRPPDMPSAVSAERPWRVGTYPGDDGITVRDGADMWVCRTIRPSQAAAIVAAVNAYHPERDALLVEALQKLVDAVDDEVTVSGAGQALLNALADAQASLRATQAEPSA